MPEVQVADVGILYVEDNTVLEIAHSGNPQSLGFVGVGGHSLADSAETRLRGMLLGWWKRTGFRHRIIEVVAKRGGFQVRRTGRLS